MALALYRPVPIVHSNSIRVTRRNTLNTTRVRLVGATTGGAHTKYIIHVEATNGNWLVYRRYSEFREFRNLMFSLLSGHTSCGGGCKFLKRLQTVLFPRRHIFHDSGDKHVLQERVTKLNIFLQAIMITIRRCSLRLLSKCESAQCPIIGLFKQFLQLTEDLTMATPAPGMFRTLAHQVEPTKELESEKEPVNEHTDSSSQTNKQKADDNADKTGEKQLRVGADADGASVGSTSQRDNSTGVAHNPANAKAEEGQNNPKEVCKARRRDTPTLLGLSNVKSTTVTFQCSNKLRQAYRAGCPPLSAMRWPAKLRSTQYRYRGPLYTIMEEEEMHHVHCA